MRSLSHESQSSDHRNFLASGGPVACAAVSTPESNVPASASPAPKPQRHSGTPGVVAAVIIGLQALMGPVVAFVFLLAAPQSAGLSNTSHVMFSVFTALFSIGLGLVALGLWQGLRWPRTGAVVWLVLLMPVGWAMVQADRVLVGVLILGSAAVGIGAVVAESRATSRTPADGVRRLRDTR